MANDKPDRSDREYPHGSGDRNTVSPLAPDKLKTFEGGTQRDPEPEAPDSPARDAQRQD